MGHTVKVLHLNDEFGFPTNKFFFFFFFAMKMDSNGNIIAAAERKTEQEALDALEE